MPETGHRGHLLEAVSDAMQLRRAHQFAAFAAHYPRADRNAAHRRRRVTRKNIPSKAKHALAAHSTKPRSAATLRPGNVVPLTTSAVGTIHSTNEAAVPASQRQHRCAS